MYCARCGIPIEDDSQACLNCGAPVRPLNNKANPHFSGSEYGNKSDQASQHGEPAPYCSFFQAIWRVLTTWTFEGRASRSEYRYWRIFHTVTVFVPFIYFFFRFIDLAVNGVWRWRHLIEAAVWAVWTLITIIPTACVYVRRYHDKQG
ncbi:MAG: DUF805 domain-containing protein [Thermoguttaceae bacterium]|jgi:hypothetical protein